MENKFNFWLKNISDKTINETYNDIKDNDKLLFSKLSAIVFCDANGYNMDKFVKKIRKMNEHQLIEFVNSELHDIEIKSIDDICNAFDGDMSNMEYFFFSYCLYNGHFVEYVYKKNIENENIDGLFEILPKMDKIEILSHIVNSISHELSSIYTKEHLIGVWGMLSNEQKINGLVDIYFKNQNETKQN